MRRSQSWCWSVLGPHGIGKHQSWAGTSGHSRYVEAAGWRMFIAPTWDAAALQRWVRIPPHGCRGPAALANDAGVTEDEPHPAAEVVPSPPGPSHVHPHRPCPKRALSIGRQRSFTDNKGRCAFPPSCRIAPYGAARGSFPSSRCPPGWAALGPRTVGATRSVTDNSGMPTPRSEHVPVDRRRSSEWPSSSLKATVRKPARPMWLCPPPGSQPLHQQAPLDESTGQQSCGVLLPGPRRGPSADQQQRRGSASSTDEGRRRSGW
jgi:hypothetical protein